MKKEKQEKPEEKKTMLMEILDWVKVFVIAIVVAMLIVTFVGQRVVVDGRSMENTLHNGDNLICDKISYRFHDPKRFDIVIVFPEEIEGKNFFEKLGAKRWVKRIIGLPGETIRIDKDGNIFVNDEKLEENFGKEVIENAGLAEHSITLGENEYWVMGDNRNNSMDSRYIGPITRDRIIGKAFIRIFPFNQIKFVK